ncbi:MAG: asparagine synthase (glutamine-hydrolyzing) [Planctomycetia bacterium]|nr:asparagine synthase (glutamine-hydrolyzing) [Planctomycetia bacterium]
MCGIAGAINLVERKPLPVGMLQAMAAQIIHRGPDEDGFLERPGLGLASRRLSIVGLSDGRQPITNEDRTVSVVFNGEFFDYPEQKARLEARGHQFRTHCDTELIPHTWEDHQEGMFEHLRGQFGFALWDDKRQTLILGRDRAGICPLFWTRQGDWLLFASEIKALLASGMVEARPDHRGICHAFTFFAVPGPITCFEGIQLLSPGRFLKVQLGGTGATGQVSEHVYWRIDFPERGDEDRGQNEKKVIDDFEQVMTAAVERRLRADVPVVSYLSGGVDSSAVVALACKVRGQPIPTFTIQIQDPLLDETSEAAIVSRHIHSDPIVVPFGAAETLSVYPRLTLAAECPVIDTSCGAMLLLAQEVHARGYKVALTGEGADEWLGGYPWFKTHHLLSFLDVIPGLPLSTKFRQLFIKLTGPKGANVGALPRIVESVGGSNAWLDIYGPMSLNKVRFFSARMWETLGDHLPYEHLQLDRDQMRRWHPLNRSLALGSRVHLPGHLLSSKGDRVAMNNSVETRYPFLDEDVVAFLAKIHPRWKMKGFGDKHILRKLAERYLPKQIAWRRKWMFRAPFDSFHANQLPPFVGQLLSEESLRKTGYFEPASVKHWGEAFRKMRPGSYQRTLVEMGLVGVVATQLWHHLYIDPTLADLSADAGRKAAAARLAV